MTVGRVTSQQPRVSHCTRGWLYFGLLRKDSLPFRVSVSAEFRLSPSGIGNEPLICFAIVGLPIRPFRLSLPGGHPAQGDLRCGIQVGTLKTRESRFAAFCSHSGDEVPVAGSIPFP